MNRFAKASALAMIAGIALAPWAHAQSPAASAQQGFTVQAFIGEVSLFLPPGMLRPAQGFGRGPGQAQQGTQQGSPQGRPQLQFTRDPKLYLTKDQVDKISPIVASLKDNPMPSPAKAKDVQSGLDAVLSAAQKAEYADYQKAIAKFRADMQSRRSASGQQGAPQGAPLGAQMSQLQRRQRMIEAFIKALGDYRAQIG